MMGLDGVGMESDWAGWVIAVLGADLVFLLVQDLDAMNG